jgi:hypothetical protein
MGILKIFGVLIFVLWAIWYIKTMLSVYTTHLKYFFEPKVNLMAKYEVGARYDAVHLKIDFWKVVLCGVFVVPVRAVFVLWMLTTYNFWAWGMMKLFGSKDLLFKS